MLSWPATCSETFYRTWDRGVTGTIGIAPSADINPEKQHPSMFEPVLGSAPDIAGKGIANPIGQIWDGAMMLAHLGHSQAAASIERAIETFLNSGAMRTPDMGGHATTSQVGKGLDCGHYLAEETPEETRAGIESFLAPDSTSACGDA